VWMLAVCTVAAPIALGCSGIWTRLTLEVALTSAAMAWACSGSRPKSSLLIPSAILFLAFLQTAPLPDGLLMRIAPVSAGAWKVAQGGVATAWSSVSVDPSASLAAIRRLLLALCVIAMVADLGRRQSYRKRLLWALAVSSCVMIMTGVFFGSAKKYQMLGFVNLAGPLSPEVNPTIMPIQTNGVGKRTAVTVGELQYELDEGYVGDGFGTYIYSNHFGGGVNLTFPILLAGWLLVTRQRVPGWVRWSVAAAGVVAVAWLVGAVAQSRAGGGALVLGSLVVMAVAAETKMVRWPLTGMLMTYATLLALVVSLALAVLVWRAESLFDLIPAPWKQTVVQNLADSRMVAAQVAFRMAAASPLLGTGFETYETVFPRFHTSPFTLFFAHNDYAQFFAEAGLCGVAIAVAAGVMFARRSVRFCTQAKGDYRVFNAGAWGALAGIGLHSALDWNLHLPANAFLACMVAGLCGSSVPATPSRAAEQLLHWIPGSIARALFIVTSMGSIGLLARDAVSEHVQRKLTEAIVLDRTDPTKVDHRDAEAALAEASADAERMASWDPRNAKLLLLAGQASLHLARHSPPGITQNARVGGAEMWFLKARQASAALRGLPTRASPSAARP